MQTTYVAPLPICNCAIPTKTLTKSFHFNVPHAYLRMKPKSISLSLSLSFPNYQTHSKNTGSFTLYNTNNCKNNNNNKQQQEKLQTNKSKSKTKTKTKTESYPYYNHILFNQFHTSLDTNTTNNQNPETQNQEKRQEKEEKPTGLFTNMWWADLKAALGQRINVEGILSSTAVLVKDRRLALPHVSVPDIRYIDWGELHRRGFKGVVFDKDNTITVPYSLTLWGPLGPSIEQCKLVFGNDIAVFSNSAGLSEYDPDGSKARALEKAIGIKVIRHRAKKPAGTAEEIEKHFGCKSSQLVMVGDRPFTDIVFGNWNGFLTILTEPLSLAEEPFIVMQVRKLEVSLMNYWFRSGLKPIGHSLLPDNMQCVKDPPPL